MKFPKKVNYLLILFLIFLALSFRFPTFPHESGSDTFAIHHYANSISQYGCAKWILSPLSYLGLYPFSYPSGIPFLLSGASQCTGIEMEVIILIISTFFGVLGVLFSYLMAKKVKNDDLFAFLVALSFALSIYFIIWTRWQISTRGPFIALLPLFVWSLLSCRNPKGRWKYILLTCILYLTLATTHRMVILVFPLIVAPFMFGLLLVYGRKVGMLMPSIRKALSKHRGTSFALSVLLLIQISLLFILPVYDIHFMKQIGFERVIPRWEGDKFDSFGILAPILNIGFDYAGRGSILLIFSLVGAIYLVFKPKKSFTEIFVVLFFLFSAPFFTDREYFIPMALPFLSLAVGFGFLSLGFIKDRKKRKYTLTAIISILIVSTMLSGYILYLNERPQNLVYHDDLPHMEDWMNEESYNTALWSKIYIDDGRIVSNHVYTDLRNSVISGTPSMSWLSIVETYPNFTERFLIETYSPIDILMYKSGYWYGGMVKTSDFLGKGGYEAQGYWGRILEGKNPSSEQLISDFDVKYVLEFKGYMRDMGFYEKYLVYYNMYLFSPFLEEVHENKYKIYDNNMELVFLLS